MGQRTAEHYRRMLTATDASIGVSLAASALYAAKHGVCEAEHHGEEWGNLVRALRAKYGEYLEPEQALAEMDAAAGDRVA